MVHKTKSDNFSWLLIFAVVILLIEITFFNGGLLFSVFMSGVFIYFGKKKFHRWIGKLALLIGVITAVVTVTNMMTFKLVLLALLGYLLYIFLQSKKQPKVYTPMISQEHPSHPTEKIISKPLLLRHTIFGTQKTPSSSYEWSDINVQHGVGDFVVDLSNTVLPKGESVISIRNMIGSIQVFVPYEVEIEINHSAVVGSAVILGNEDQHVFNQSIHYQTALYDEGEHKIKIITSTVVGNIEVKRI